MSACPSLHADATAISECDMGAKRSQIEVPMAEFASALRKAMDDIGCRNSVCREPGSDVSPFVKMTGGAALAEVEVINGRELYG
jgi:hypothetical protein